MAASQDASNADSRRATTPKDDAALTPPAITYDSTGHAMSFWGKVAVFILVPTGGGCLGLYVAFLETYQIPNRKLTIESDFAMPFILMLFITIVIGFRTRGFSSTKMEPFIKMPRIQKKRKIIHKHIVKGQDPNSAPDHVSDNYVATEGHLEDKRELTAKKKD